MDFFTKLADLIGEGYQVTITVIKTEDKMTVGIIPQSIKKNESTPLMQHLIITALPGELDEEFFEKLTTPLAKTRGVMANIVTYEASLQKANAEVKGKIASSAKPAGNPSLTPKAENAGLDLFSQTVNVTNPNQTLPS